MQGQGHGSLHAGFIYSPNEQRSHLSFKVNGDMPPEEDPCLHTVTVTHVQKVSRARTPQGRDSAPPRGQGARGLKLGVAPLHREAGRVAERVPRTLAGQCYSHRGPLWGRSLS